MSTLPESELDLEKLFLPAWAQEPPSAKHYAQYEGEGERKERKGEGRGNRFNRRENFPGERRPRGERRGPRRPGENRAPQSDRPDRRREEQRERREPPPPLPEVNVTLIPEERGVESLARQIRNTGRAYPLFEIARLILQKPERYNVTFSVKKKADGQAAQPLFGCALDDSLWLSEEEAVAHVLKNHFTTFYQVERTATEPPKGKYTFVAQCGMSGVILGPPNYHDYQNQLRKLHAERFSRMPFDVFKSRVKIVRDEAVVKKWVDDQSWKTEYVCLNMPEPLRLGSLEAVEKHFRQVHKDTIIKPIESQTLTGVQARGLRCSGLVRLVRQVWEDQRRFPLQLATVLSQQFAAQGLQFFKVNKTVTHVSVARPHYLDLDTTPVSTGVRRIVDYINATPKCTRRKLIEALAPAPPVPVPPPAPAEIPVPAPAAGDAPAPAPGTPAPAPQGAPAPTPEQTALVADLHWLIHQGHVIEFANGIMETAKKPAPKPPKPEPKPAQPATPAPEPPGEIPAAGEAVTGEVPVAVSDENGGTPPVEPEAQASEVPPVSPAPDTLSAPAIPDSSAPVPEAGGSEPKSESAE